MTDPQTPPPAEPGPQNPPDQVDVTEVDTQEPPATTAGEENHGKPDKYRGEDADAPADTGTSPQEN